MDETVSVKHTPPLRWKSRCGRYTVTVSPTCLNHLLDMACGRYPCEVGTSLVGCYSSDGFDATVLDTVPLSSDSRGSATSFYRGVKGLRRFFAVLRRTYLGRRYYVGEWHSHPDASPTPSYSDDEDLSAIASDTQTNCPECILVILGGNPFDVPELGVFVYSRKEGRVDLFPDEE